MPGVPPDAVDNVKKLFKGLFKRGKKRQDKPADSTPPTSTQPPTTSTTHQQAPVATNGGAPNTDKPLPPTNPVESVPPSAQQPPTQKSDAQTGTVDNSQKLGQDVDSQAVSPSSTTPAAASEPVSAIEGSTPPAPPPKNDATVEVPKTVETPANKENVAPPAAGQKVESAPAAAAIAPTQPNGTAAEAKKVEQPANGEKVADAAEEKVAVHEEPPAPVKAANNAPGMSATSGPLEDFPEGVVHQ
ncbi:hypothetical protein M409DRAFT_30250 [Zasmidium cellare ATCC 36951]|uniref:Uncharacterized protein n=1 Tax=Zasmidium cellare ATCC 36951 TaxID=1080233 RepID=A0A6A6BWN5_ZASCE|nr:uncharacterized protein M409DRAFT_30250 [Zasmidium cellare ATCC 36951]KAF2159244.1 hypothetical protein M409DRAFT_30250 [Zasmidium cellare ATCC 36951]